jgi:RNA recognition motif-containing protein
MSSPAVPSRRLFLGNLAYEATEADVQKAFAAVGVLVCAVTIAKDYEGRPRGFAFVELDASDAHDVDGAIALINGTQIRRRALRPNRARERPERRDRPQGDRSIHTTESCPEFR